MFVSASCQGEICHCGQPAVRKVGEEILFDDPNPARHNLTRYVCSDHFGQLFGIAAWDGVDAKPRIDLSHKDGDALLEMAAGFKLICGITETCPTTAQEEALDALREECRSAHKQALRRKRHA